MSGVNGGLDYDLDLNIIPASLRSHVESILQGPDSPDSFIDSMQMITVWIRERDGQACDSLVPFLVDSLGYNNPLAARLAQDVLVEVYGSRAITTLLQGVAAFNYSVNAYALRALAAIGVARPVFPIAVQCARQGPIPNVRRAAVHCLGSLRYDDDADKEEDGSMREQALALLLELLQDHDWSVRYAAIPSLLLLLGSRPDSRVSEALHAAAESDRDETVRARAALALYSRRRAAHQ